MEAHWDGSKPGDFHIFAWPDEKAEKNRFEISIPRGASLILTHDPNGLFPGLNSVPPSDRPPVKVGVLRLPHHAGDRLLHDRGRAATAPSCGGAARCSTTRWYLRVDGAELVDRLRRGDRRLDRHRKRPPALDRARHPAHRRRHLAGARPTASRVTLVLFVVVYGDRVLVRHLLHQPPDRQRAGQRREAEARRPIRRAARSSRGRARRG